MTDNVLIDACYVVLAVNVDECLIGNGSCSHTCVNTPATYTCYCPPGYTLYLGEDFNGFGDRTDTLDVNHTCVCKCSFIWWLDVSGSSQKSAT